MSASSSRTPHASSNLCPPHITQSASPTQSTRPAHCPPCRVTSPPHQSPPLHCFTISGQAFYPSRFISPFHSIFTLRCIITFHLILLFRFVFSISLEPVLSSSFISPSCFVFPIPTHLPRPPNAPILLHLPIPLHLPKSLHLPVPPSHIFSLRFISSLPPCSPCIIKSKDVLRGELDVNQCETCVVLGAWSVRCFDDTF